MTRAVINTSVATIRGKNGRPFPGGRMRGIMHPYALSDAANDKTINGLLDVLKHSADGQKSIEDGLVRDNEIRTIEGVDFVMSTNVPLVSGAPVSGKSSYATYITADEMMFSIALGGFLRNKSCGAEPLTCESKMCIWLYRGTSCLTGQSRRKFRSLKPARDYTPNIS